MLLGTKMSSGLHPQRLSVKTCSDPKLALVNLLWIGSFFFFFFFFFWGGGVVCETKEHKSQTLVSSFIVASPFKSLLLGPQSRLTINHPRFRNDPKKQKR